MEKEEILSFFDTIGKDKVLQKKFATLVMATLELTPNQFHPLVFIHGNPEIGKNVYIGLFSEVNAKHSKVTIGENCDIASFVSINVADSHKKSVGLAEEIERKPITIENDVFVGSHCFIKGGAHIGHHSVIAAGTVVDGIGVPPYSLVYGQPAVVKSGYYKKKGAIRE